MKYLEILYTLSASALLTAGLQACSRNTDMNASQKALEHPKWDQSPNLQRFKMGKPLSADQTCALWQECTGR